MKKFVKENISLPDGDPPSEFRLIKYGVTESTQGPYMLDQQSAKEVMTTFKNRNIKLNFDYNHASINPRTPEDGIAAGWYDLDLREDGIWAKNIKWTDKAFNHLKSREYAYYSPTFKRNKNGYVTRIVNAAICNLPGSNDIDPIVALNERDDLLETFQEFTSNLDKNSLSNDSLETLEEITRQLNKFSETIKEMDKETDKTETVEVKEDLLNSSVDNSLNKGEKVKEKLERLDESMDGIYSMGEHLSRRMMEHTDSDLKDVYSKAHGLSMKMAELFTTKRKELDPDSIFMPKPVNMYSEKLYTEIETLTGEKDYDRQVGKVLAYKEAMDTVVTLSESLKVKEDELENLKGVILLSEKVKLVDEAIHGKDKKLMPKQRDWALGLSKTQLETYLEVSPVIKLSEKIVDKELELEAALVQLTEMDKHFIKEQGLDEKAYLANKQKRFAK